MTRHRIAALTAAVVTLLSTVGLALSSAAPAGAAADQDRLSVTIDSLSPTYLAKGRPITMSGRISNPTKHRWSDLKVYLVIPRQPLTTRDQVDEAVSDPQAANGDRVVDVITQAGDLAPGSTTTFTLTVPYNLLNVSGASGVYPVGAQVLATDDDGNRANEAVGRAYTVIPSLQSKPAQDAKVSVIWPFVVPVQRLTDGRYAGSKELLREISPGGRLRRLLDLARSVSTSSATVLIDPAMLDALEDMATGTYGPPRQTDGTPSPTATSEPTTSPDSDQESAASPARVFLDDLVALARRQAVWAVQYGEPDAVALTKRANARTHGAVVAKAAARATTATLERFGLDARLVYRPPGGIASATNLSRAATLGTDAAIVSPSVLPGWADRDGPFLQLPIHGTVTPVLVQDSDLMDGGTQGGTALELRQRIASEAVLAETRGKSPTGAGPQVAVLVDPSWDPGTEWSKSSFGDLFSAPWVTATDAGQGLTEAQKPWQGGIRLPHGAHPKTITNAQVRAAALIVRKAKLLSTITAPNKGRSAYYDATAALSVSQQWRSARAAGTKSAQDQASKLEAKLDKVTVEATPYVTLSGNRGRFPITITNHLSTPVTVGVHLASDNSALRIDDVKPDEVAPGQSRTVTVTADVGEVSNSAVTATLTTPDGDTFGTSVTFSVRSSVVGTIIWIGMGAAGVLLVLALGRRFLRRRGTRGRLATASSAPSDDDHGEDD